VIKKKKVLLVVGLLIGVIGIAIAVAMRQTPAVTAPRTSTPPTAMKVRTSSTPKVPAHYESLEEIKDLPSVLSA
jgi:hypothetical protein